MSKMVFGRYDIAVYLTFVAYAVCSMAIPMCLVPLAVDLGFPLTDGGMGLGGMLQLGRSIPMVGAMLVCGFIGGIWGKRRSLGFSVLLMSVGIMLCSIAPTYGVLFAALAIAGMGEGILEGLVTPFVQDLHPDQPGRYLNVSHSFWSVGVIVLVIGAGAALAFGASWRIIVFAAAMVAAAPALLFLIPSKTAPVPKTEERVHWKDVIAKTRDIVKIPRFWLFFIAMFFAGGGEFCLTFWCASFIQLEFGGSAIVAGAGTACFAAGMFVGRFWSGIAVHQHNLKKLIVGCAVAATAVCLFFPWIRSVWTLFALLFLAGAATGPFWPSIQSDGALRVKGDYTMQMILYSCAGIPGSGFFAMVIGVVGDWVGLRMSFLVAPLCFLVVFGLMLYDYRVEKKESHETPSRRINRNTTASARM